MPNIIITCGGRGFQKPCTPGQSNTGGITGQLLAIPSSAITAVTQNAIAGTTQNAYTAFTITAGSTFRIFDIDKLSGSWKEEYQPNSNGTGGSWNVTIGFSVAGENQDVTNFVSSITSCCSDWTFLITDNNGNTKVFTTATSTDYAGGSLKVSKVEEGTGQALNDYNGSTIEIAGIMPKKSNFFTGSIAALPKAY